MKKSILSVCLMTLAWGGLQAQQQGGISEDMLREIRKAYKGTAADKALLNAITANDIRVLALNHENAADFDTYFSDKVLSRGITDQNHRAAAGCSRD